MEKKLENWLLQSTNDILIKMKEFFHHLFIPRKSNNYKAKLLHHTTLLLFIAFFIIGGLLLNLTKTKYPSVLGISTDMTSEQLLTLLNQKRQENGLPLLSFSPELAAAAKNKANDMLFKNYWAHNSPDGKTPWEFFKEAGYSYVYAGENLARGFNTSFDVTNAWMASPTHRANMLSSNYSDVGFAVVTGNLSGEETVLVVEEFGDRALAALPPQAESRSLSSSSNNPQEITLEKAVAANPNRSVQSSFKASPPSGVQNFPLIDSLHLTTNIGTFIVLMFILTLISETIILERRKIVSLAEHNPDHIFFLISVLLIIVILGRGVIL